MYNLILMASRYIEWWRGEHAEVTYNLPGLRRWLHTDVQDAFEERSKGWDGVSILSFDTKEDLDKALASEEWAAAVRHVGRMRGHRIAVMGEERTMVG